MWITIGVWRVAGPNPPEAEAASHAILPTSGEPALGGNHNAPADIDFRADIARQH